MSNTFQNNGQQEQEPKSQRKLWTVCGILAALLAVVNLRGGAEEEEEDAAVEVAIVAEPASETRAPDRWKSDNWDLVRRNQSSTNWPTFSVDSLLENNPFRIREPLEEKVLGTPEVQEEREAVKEVLVQSDDEPSETTTEELLAGLGSTDVRLVFHGPHGAAAFIGDTLVHEGDTIEGLHVVRILPDGIIVEAVVSE